MLSTFLHRRFILIAVLMAIAAISLMRESVGKEMTSGQVQIHSW